jgi:hypothetical protein
MEPTFPRWPEVRSRHGVRGGDVTIRASPNPRSWRVPPSGFVAFADSNDARRSWDRAFALHEPDAGEWVYTTGFGPASLAIGHCRLNLSLRQDALDDVPR